jgi:hypothetical protein
VTPTAGEFLVNTNTFGHQSQADVAADAGGDSVIVWASGGANGTASGIRGQLYDRAGRPRGGEFVVSATETGDEQTPSVAMDAAGNFLALWNVYRGGLGEPPPDLFAQRFDVSGVKLGAAFKVNLAGGSFPGAYDLAMSADGAFAIAYKTSAGTGDRLFVQKYDADAAPMGGAQEVASTGSANVGIQTPLLGLRPDGRYVVAWGEAPQVYPLVYRSFLQWFDAAGAPSGGRIEFFGNAASHFKSDMALDAAGNLAFVYQDFPDAYLARFTPDGQPSGSSTRLPSYPPSTSPIVASSEMARMAYEPGGNLLVTWSRGIDEQPDVIPWHRDVYAREFRADGQPVAPEFRLNQYIADEQRFSRVAVGGNGGVVIAWNSGPGNNDPTRGQDGSGWGVFGRRLAPGGDADSDGNVNFNDLIVLAENYNSTGKSWANGDFTGDGSVDFSDLVILAQNFNTGLPAPGAAAAPAEFASIFAADRTAAGTSPSAAAGGQTKKKLMPKPVFSLAAVARPVPVKSRTSQNRRR